MDTTINHFVTTQIEAEWASLLAALVPQIADEYRIVEEDDEPGMLVTFGFTPETKDKDASWSYQTGDNSYAGSAYGHPYWGLAYLYRDSDCAELASEAAEEINSQIAQEI